MKKIYKVVSLLVLLIIAAQNSFVTAATSEVRRFSGTLSDGTSVEIVYVPENLKLGLITKDAEGNPTSGYIFTDVESLSDKFYRTAASTFGKVDDGLFVTIEISNVQGSSATISIDNGPVQTLQQQESGTVESLIPFGNCGNYCYPSDPNHYNWYLCFWCCATTGRSPC